MDDPLLTIRSLFRKDPSEKGYTEYGYRGLEEIKKANEKIIELKKVIEELRKRLEENGKDT